MIKINLWSIIKKLFVSFWFIFYIIFVVGLIGGCAFAGVWTMIPTDLLGWGATKPCILGYVAHCSWTPWSSLILFGMAAIGIPLLVHIVKSLWPKYWTYLKGE